jgi:large subunit ribosomal protein L13
MKTFSPKPQDIERRWYVIDATGAVLGRLSSEVAAILRGKHKPIFAPHADTGDHVIVINARGIVLTGGKEAKKFAYRHSGYPGGLTATQYTRLLSDRPEFAVEKAIRGMLPKNRLGRTMAKKLQVYPGPEHPHTAQKPVELKLGEIPPWTGLPELKTREPKAKPEPTAPAAKRSTAKRSTAKPAAKRSTTKAAAKPAAKASTAKKPAAKTTTKTTTAKASTEKKPTARRTKKEA